MVSLGQVERTKPQPLYSHSGYAEACRTNMIHFNRLQTLRDVPSEVHHFRQFGSIILTVGRSKTVRYGVRSSKKMQDLQDTLKCRALRASGGNAQYDQVTTKLKLLSLATALRLQEGGQQDWDDQLQRLLHRPHQRARQDDELQVRALRRSR